MAASLVASAAAACLPCLVFLSHLILSRCSRSSRTRASTCSRAIRSSRLQAKLCTLFGTVAPVFASAAHLVDISGDALLWCSNALHHTVNYSLSSSSLLLHSWITAQAPLLLRAVMMMSVGIHWQLFVKKDARLEVFW